MADSSTYTIRLNGGVDAGVFTSITKLQDQVTKLGEGLKRGAEFLGITLGFRELINLGKEAVEAANAMGHLAQEVGIGVEQLSKLKYAADISEAGEHFRQGMLKLSAAIAESQDKSSKAAQTFALIGVATKDMEGKLRPTDQVLYDVAEKFRGWADGANKAAISAELFGNKNAQFISFLNQGRAGLQAMGDELERIGGVLTEHEIQKTEEYHRAMTQLHTEFQSLTRSVALDMLPAITSLIKALTDTGTLGGKLSPAFEALVGTFKYFTIGVVEAYGILQVFGTAIGQTAAAAWEVVHGHFSEAKGIMKGLSADLDELQKKRYAQIDAIRNPIPEIVRATERRTERPEAPSIAGQKAQIRDELEALRERLKLKQDEVALERERVAVSFDLTIGEKRDREVALIDQETRFLQEQIDLLKQKRALTADDALRARYDKEIFSLSDKSTQLGRQRIGITDSADPRKVSDELRKTLTQWREQIQNLGTIVGQTVNGIKGAFSSVGDSILELVNHTKTFGQVWLQAGQQVFSVITKMVSEYVAAKLAMMAVDAFVNRKNRAESAATTAASIPAGIAQAGAQGGWLGILIYIGVFAAAMAAITALASAAAGGFESGGYTGDTGRGDPAGIVHGQEYVLNAPATAYYGRDLLDAMNRRQAPVSSGPAPAQSQNRGGRQQPIQFAFINDRQDMRDFQAREGAKITADFLRKRGVKTV